MAADILLYDSNQVPVGKDQKQHLEVTRDIAVKLNETFGDDCVVLPEPIIREDTAVVVGLDGRKMSKSYGNTIPLFASDAEIEKAVMSIVTDSSGDVPVNVYAIHKLFKSEAELAPLYEANKGKYKALKDALASDIKAFVTPMRARYEELLANPKIVEDVLSAGAEVVKTRAEQKMVAVKKGVGLLL